MSVVVEGRVLKGLVVAEVLSRWPQVIPVFLSHRMACVGCAAAPFETVAEVAGIYGLPLDSFLDELLEAMKSPRHGTSSRDE